MPSSVNVLFKAASVGNMDAIKMIHCTIEITIPTTPIVVSVLVKKGI